jgi:uncharacterized protein (TIGR02246 family)
MKPLLSVGLLALLTTTAIAAGPAKKPASEEAGIMKTADAFFSAWNQHDVKTMVSFWADDATLINPMGRVAHGKAEIEALLTDEQNTVFKSSTAKVLEMKVTRSLGPNMAFCDGAMTVDGAVSPDGTAMPQMKLHLAVIMEKQGANWKLADARPYSFTQPPPAATKTD